MKEKPERNVLQNNDLRQNSLLKKRGGEIIMHKNVL